MVNKKIFLLVGLLLLQACTIDTNPNINYDGQEWYNTSEAFTGKSTYTGMLQYSNDITFGMWGLFTVLGIFTVFFIIFKYNFDARDAFLGASFLAAVSSIILRVIGLVSEYVVIAGIVMVAGGLVSTLWRRQ